MNKKQILRYTRNFKSRLAEAVIAGALEEVDIYDNRDNLVLTPDLKVKHKSSGYEYTVDHVEGEDDDAVVYLRHPEIPRVDPQHANTSLTEKTTIKVKDLRPQAMSAEELPRGPIAAMPDKISLEKPSDVPEQTEEVPEQLPGEDLLAVKKKEFEKNYEVE